MFRPENIVSEDLASSIVSLLATLLEAPVTLILEEVYGGGIPELEISISIIFISFASLAGDGVKFWGTLNFRVTLCFIFNPPPA